MNDLRDANTSLTAIRVLGPFEADVAGRNADLGGARQQAVLAILVIARGDVVAVDRLLDDLWRDSPPPKARSVLQAYVSRLRRALEPERQPRTPMSVITNVAPGYALRLPTETVDAWRFEALIRHAEQHADPAAVCRLLERALALWHGSAFAAFASASWAVGEIARLGELRAAARERWIDAAVQAGYPPARLVADAQELVRESPLREEGWRLLALSQYLAGRQADALRTLRSVRTMLAEELGIDPGPALAEMERAVRAQQVMVLATAGSVGSSAPSRERHRTRRLWP